MLGKLIKNEFNSNLHSIGLIYAVAAICVGFMALSYVFKITWISAVATVILMLAGGAAVLVTLVCVVMNFQKSLYRDEGYLFFTLPVTSGQLLTAKTICSFCWMLLSCVAAIGIFFGVYIYASMMVGDDVKVALELISTFFLQLPSKGTIIEVIVLICLYCFLLLVVLIAQLYFAITIANTRVLQKLGAFSGFAAFLAIFIVMTVCYTYLTNSIPLTLVVTTDGVFYTTAVSMAENSLGISFGLAGIIFDIIAAAALFWGTGRLMNSKINIK